MDDDLSDLRNRQTRTERRVAHLETKVDQETRSRVRMDKELGKVTAAVNAHTQSLNALRETQAEQGQLLRHIVTKVDNTEAWMGYLNGRMDVLQQDLTGRMDSLESQVTGLGGRMDGVETRLDRVDTRLDGIDTRLDRVDARLDSVDTRLDGMDARLGGVEGRLGGVETELAGVKAGVDEILSRLGKG